MTGVYDLSKKLFWKDCHGTFFLGLKILTGIIALAMFASNTWKIFKSYAEGDTTLIINSQSVKELDFGMPTFVLCAVPPFLNSSRFLQTHQDFEENTVDPLQFVTKMEVHSLSDLSVSIQ